MRHSRKRTDLAQKRTAKGTSQAQGRLGMKAAIKKSAAMMPQRTKEKEKSNMAESIGKYKTEGAAKAALARMRTPKGGHLTIEEGNIIVAWPNDCEGDEAFRYGVAILQAVHRQNKRTMAKRKQKIKAAFEP
jgi:hypothetical protein